jgi:hypothetical protein
MDCPDVCLKALWLQEWEWVLEDCHKRSCWKNSIGVGFPRPYRLDVYVCSKSFRLCLTVVYWFLECNKVPSWIENPEYVTVCIACIMYQQLWGYKVEEKLYLGVREQKRLNTTVLDCCHRPYFFSVLSVNWTRGDNAKTGSVWSMAFPPLDSLNGAVMWANVRPVRCQYMIHHLPFQY